jgi:16S rRNA (cytosine1402-N4)-methyltransferase
MDQHLPVLKKKVTQTFEKMGLQTFLDGTLGLGGHAALLLQEHPEIQKYVGLDQDPNALMIAQKNLEPWKEKIEIHRVNFQEMGELFSSQSFDGILLDIGVSSLQLDTKDRGFSFQREGPLDMRMDPDQTLTAEEIVNRWSEAELGRIFREWGEEKRWRQAARAIVEARRKKKIRTTLELAELLKPHLKGGKIHPATLVFQALRIATNKELEVLESVLPVCFDLLKIGGSLAVISFHSLEDRIVKNAFRDLSKEKKGFLVTKKPLIADREEIRFNPRSRSAKLRVIKRLE